jgi:hypothetical protein
MKRKLLILLLGFCYSLYFYSQENEKRGWSIFEFFNMGLGYRFNEKKIGITTVDFIKYSTSLGKATPYQRFGIGSELFEVVNFQEGCFITPFPINLHFIPWMKLETYEYYDYQDRGSYRQGNYIVHSYSYDPNKTIYTKAMQSAFLITLSGSFWSIYKPKGFYTAADEEDFRVKSNSFNCRASYILNLTAKEKNRGLFERNFSISADFNNYVAFFNGKYIYLPSISLKLSFLSVLN